MASNLWNDASLSSPPITAYEASGDSLDVSSLRRTVDDALTLLNDQLPLHKDAAILSRLHYRMGTKFRHDIGYSSLRKTHVALLKYVNFNIKTGLQTFADVLVSNAGLYLPTRQMLEYVLVRFQTLAKLLCRIVLCSKTSAAFFLDRIKRGDAWWLSVMPYAVLARIWYATRRLLKNLCKWYATALSFRSRLKEIGVSFVPPDYIFPRNLSAWLDFDDKMENGQSWMYDSANIFQRLESDDANAPVDEEEIDTKEETDAVISYLNANIVPCDVGEIVSRENYESRTISEEPLDAKSPKNRGQKKSAKKRAKTPAQINFENIKDVSSFKKIFETEDLYRSDGDSRSTTSHLSLMQWESLKIVMNRLISKAAPMKKIKRTWTDRCSV